MNSKFNNIYNLIIENIDPVLVSNAIDICNDKKNTDNSYIKTLESQFEKIVYDIINSSNIISKQHLSNRKTIQYVLINKGFMGIATKAITNLLNIYKNDAKLLAQSINKLEINPDQIYTYNDLSYEFMIRLFSYIKLNKTTSTTNIGKGQLLLTLILKDALFSGIDDLKINGKNYNVKYINKDRANKNALMSHQDIGNSEIYFHQLQRYSTNYSEFKLEKYQNNPNFTSLLQDYIQLITRNVHGYILVTDNYDNNKFNLQFLLITKNQIKKNPYQYLYSLKYNNQRPGIYFKGEILFQK